jgi:chromosome segregation ATPase
MTLKDFWSSTKSKTSNWLQTHKPSEHRDYEPQVDEQGLIGQADESAEPTDEKPAQSKPVVVKALQPSKKQEPIEKLQKGFGELVEQLRGINEHLNRQADQHADLMSRIEQFPQLLENFPAMVANQKAVTEQMLEQLKAAAARDLQFMDAVEKIPNETAKQTDALVNIDHQLAAAADTDVQMAESFNKFNETLGKLNQSANSQTDGILQMSKTFATSDRYLKYLMSKQNRRFAWIFVTAIGACLAAILILAGIIIYVVRYQ